MRISHAIAFVLVLLCPVADQAQRRRSRQPATATRRPLSAREIAQKAYSSTVVIYANDANGTTVAEGSGFFVKPNVIATSYHVIEDALQIEASMVLYPTIRFGAKLIRFDEKSDLALLDVSPAKGPAILLAGESDIYVGDTVYTIGNPKGLGGTFSSGIISATRELDGVWSIQITAPVSPGSSGGPVLGGNGRVIGIVQSQYREGQNLNFAVLATHLSILISGKTDVAANVYRVPDSNEPPPPAEWVAIAGSETNVYLMNTRKSPTKTAKGTIFAPDKVIPRLDSEEGRASYNGDVAILASEIGNMQLALSYSFQIEMVEYNCTQRATRILYRVFYDKVGKEFHKTTVPEGWNHAVPSTISDTMLRRACGFTSRN